MVAFILGVVIGAFVSASVPAVGTRLAAVVAFVKSYL